jgi:hypothetical protein
MAWTAPRTWVTSEMVTAALMNTHVRDNLLFLLTDIPDLTVASIDHTASPYSAAGYVVVLGNTSGGNITVNLPAVAASTGVYYYIKNTGTGTLTLDGNLSEPIEGETTQALLQNDCALIVCDGAAWWLI